MLQPFRMQIPGYKFTAIPICGQKSSLGNPNEEDTCLEQEELHIDIFVVLEPIPAAPGRRPLET